MTVLYCPPKAPPAFSSDDVAMEILRRRAQRIATGPVPDFVPDIPVIAREVMQ